MAARGPVATVEGARQLRASLKRAGIQLSDLKAAHAEVAELVRSRADPRAPRRTGRLAGTMRAAGTQSAAIVRAGTAAVPYAGPIHWGWPARGIVARPWIYEAAADSQDQWADTYLHALEKIIDSIEGAPGP